MCAGCAEYRWRIASPHLLTWNGVGSCWYFTVAACYCHSPSKTLDLNIIELGHCMYIQYHTLHHSVQNVNFIKFWLLLLMPVFQRHSTEQTLLLVCFELVCMCTKTLLFHVCFDRNTMSPRNCCLANSWSSWGHWGFSVLISTSI